MKTTKFHQLCAAYDTAQSNFENYKQNCHNFAIELVKSLKLYYAIPEQQFTLYKIKEQNNFDLIHGSLLGALTLTPESYWHFGIGLTVCRAPESFPEELILIHVIFRKEKGNTYYLKHAYGEKEFKVTYKNPDSYAEYFDDLFDTIISSYNGHIQQFIGEKTTRKLGYLQ